MNLYQKNVALISLLWFCAFLVSFALNVEVAIGYTLGVLVCWIGFYRWVGKYPPTQDSR